MAGLMCIVTTPNVALVADTAKTVLQIAAPTNQRLKIKRWAAFCDGVAGDAVPIDAELVYQSSAGTMTSVDPKKQGNSGSETIQTTAAYNASAEPTTGDIADMAKPHPQTGYEVIIPFDMPIELAGGGRLGIVCKAAAAVNVRAKIVFEE